jgi:hypothetical protein
MYLDVGMTYWLERGEAETTTPRAPVQSPLMLGLVKIDPGLRPLEVCSNMPATPQELAAG